MATEVEQSEYKGNKLLVIWELDKNGQRKEYPLFSFGKKKAQAILENIDEIENFVAQESK